MIKNLHASAGDPGLFRHQEDPLEKEIATHSSIPAWEIPWTEEAGRLKSKESHRVGQDRVTNTHFSGLDMQHFLDP